ncbi:MULTISPECIES: pirin family protein [unclassified Nocardioides]|uniref:pirin family protein n=1 Tax=unclassified Nocardioides TaxID=2615069 RepID=UPI001E45E3E1|nr:MULTISPECIES: pirin family protein [unclassified Nocardioides]
MTTEIRRSSARFTERYRGRVTHHSFSFGEHYDPERLRLGPMVCHDDHLLARGQGFETHRHSGLDIVTWVVSGALEHTGPVGPDGATGTVVLEPGSVAVLRTGSGVEHAEIAVGSQTRFVQVWLTAAADAPEQPSYDVRPVDLDAAAGALVPVTEVAGATLSAARLDTGSKLLIPGGPLTHVYVATGALLRSSLAQPLAAGDAFVFTDEPAHQVTAAVPTDLLVWTLPTDPTDPMAPAAE